MQTCPGLQKARPEREGPRSIREALGPGDLDHRPSRTFPSSSSGARRSSSRPSWSSRLHDRRLVRSPSGAAFRHLGRRVRTARGPEPGAHPVTCGVPREPRATPFGSPRRTARPAAGTPRGTRGRAPPRPQGMPTEAMFARHRRHVGGRRGHHGYKLRTIKPAPPGRHPPWGEAATRTIFPHGPLPTSSSARSTGTWVVVRPAVDLLVVVEGRVGRWGMFWGAGSGWNHWSKDGSVGPAQLERLEPRGLARADVSSMASRSCCVRAIFTIWLHVFLS